MNSYELSRSWFDWCFENPEKIKPIHSAVYFFAIEHCNRLGWKNKFGFPSQMAMEALGIKKHQTYISAFNDITDWGGFELVQKSKNQYSANIITISAMPKNGKALDKALVKHRAKQGQSTGQSEGHIDKQVTIEQETINIEFDVFWNLYDKKVGDKKSCQKKWDKIKIDVKQKIIDTLPAFKSSIKDKQFMPFPETYLNNERWNDVIEEKQSKKSTFVSCLKPEDLKY